MGSSLFPSHGFAMEEHQKKQIQDLNLTGLTFKALSTASVSEEQSTAGAKNSKFGSYGWSEHSSSSGLSSPFGSELGSTETDETESEEDEDFIAQLTRQMADYMLKDDDEEEEEGGGDVAADNNDSEENRVPNYTPNSAQSSNPSGLAGTWSNYNSSEICYYNKESLSAYVKPTTEYSADSVKNSNTVLYSSDDLKRPIQVYHLKDQPTTLKQRPSKGKRVKGTTTTESVQKLKTEKNRNQNNMQNTFTNKQTVGGHGDKILHHHHPIQSTGAGMRAIFLGGSGSINGSSGTGVFLPRRINPTANEPKKKSGGSTVLIPARVLQALQQHFNHMDVLSQSNTCPVSPTHLPKYDAENETEGFVWKENQDSEDQTRRANVVNDQEMQLPQEWTY
ncbi:PREDICTED: uncharacterized protein LOC109239383 [Nicotiana attenuata]|uniref:Uncharacterized protein n=1 Tax=Nicotiana attenuata TaxID=49451 RepID=A0A314LA59_NICAT|nr:PREDICTED: uncharacterized protein LOC109239383 [Nicotiana attenuata]OIT38468.1 hypothetical protein A4A49_04455 [Nicotiana attenuata]